MNSHSFTIDGVEYRAEPEKYMYSCEECVFDDEFGDCRMPVCSFNDLCSPNRIIWVAAEKSKQSTGHIHADLMAEYAKDSATNDKAWLNWECRCPSDDDWDSLQTHPGWQPDMQYRRKPRSITICDMSFPAPITIKPKIGEEYWTALDVEGSPHIWSDSQTDNLQFDAMLIHSTAVAAAAHHVALFALNKAQCTAA